MKLLFIRIAFVCSFIIIFLAIFGRVDAVAQSKRIKSKINDIPAGNCYMTASIVKVFRKLDKSTPNMPCGKVPCMAKIRIIKVEGYGPSFYGELNDGDVVTAQFVLTLLPTDKSLFPGMKGRYPGLKKGDVFTAYLKAYMLPKDNKVYFTVGDYKLGKP